ncbi:MAG TPA: adenylate kinase [Sulfurovum sp.]|nr:adenylate kinase [Sulfurovum sp.]
MSKKLILIIGAPGSGKTTDGGLVAKNHRDTITSYSMGELLKDEIDKNTTLGKINSQFVSRGELVPTAIVIDKTIGIIKNAPTDIVLLDGFPRKAKQMRVFADVLTNDDEIELISVIEIRVSEAVARQRVLGREDGRDDDEEEVFNNRMRIYAETIEEIEAFYKDKGLLKVIDGERELQVVVEEIDSFLGSQVSL